MKHPKIFRIINFIDFLMEGNYLIAIFLIPLVFAPDSLLAFYQQPKESLLHLTGFSSIFLITIKLSLDNAFNLQSSTIKLITTNKKVSWLLFAIFLFLISNLLSTWLSIAPYSSFWGRESGMAGNTMISLISYLGIFSSILITVRTNNQIKRILFVIVSSGILICIYGLFQHFFPENIAWYTWMNKGRVYSTLGNPIYLGAYLIMTIPISIVLLSQLSKIIGFKLFLLISSLLIGIQLSVLVFTLSRGPWSGLLAGILCVIGYWVLFSRKLKTSFVLFITTFLAGLIVAVLIIAIPVKNEELNIYDPLIERVGSISKSLELSLESKSGINVSGSGLSGRIEMWQGAFELIRKWPSPNGLDLSFKSIRPLIGYGPDTYIYVYPQTIRPQKNIVVSSHPHNLILQIFVELGLFGVLTLLSVFLISFLIIIDLLKETKSSLSFSALLTIGLLVGITGHIIEQMTGLGVTSDTLIFWVFISLICVTSIINKPYNSKTEEHLSAQTSLKQPTKLSYLYLLFNLPVLTILIFVLNQEINSIKASRYLIQGLELVQQEKAADGLILLEKARIMKPYSETYSVESFKLIRKSAMATSLGLDNKIKTERHLHAFARLKDFENLNPYSYNVEMFLARTSLDLFLVNPNFRLEVLNRYIYLTQLMPNYIDIFKISANIFLSIGAFDLALETTNKAFDLNNKLENVTPLPQAYWVRGEIFKIREQYDSALLDFEQAILDVDKYITDKWLFSQEGGVSQEKASEEKKIDEQTLNKKRAYEVLANQSFAEILSFYDPGPLIKKCLNFENSEKESEKRYLRSVEIANAYELLNLIKPRE